MMVSKRGLGGRGNIARVLTKRVHFAAFVRVWIFDHKYRK
jgi:hypothetical protein